jgi:hypothetical protein
VKEEKSACELVNFTSVVGEIDDFHPRGGAFVKFTHLHKQINPPTTKTEQIHPHFCTNSPITYPDLTYSRGCLL